MRANSLNEFFGTLLQSVTEAHKAHLSTGKYSKHKALDEYYENMPEAVDALIEHYQGLHGKVGGGFTNLIPDPVDIVVYFEELVDMCSHARTDWFADDDTLKSDIDAVSGIIASALYQIRELKESADKKTVLMVLEKTDSELRTCTDNDTIYLEGVFTEFGVRNRNNRIYSANDFVPKLMELMPSVKAHTLLGELDHPTNFDTSLQNASHVIEDLRYDQEKNCVFGKIRLLNTRSGKDAQALVRDGIPLHISSRASGKVDNNGNVTLDKLFTYDLVAEPGFANAELYRVSESYTFDGGKENSARCLNERYGFGGSDSVRIYECEISENIDNKNMNNKTVNQDDFQKYTEYMAGVLDGLKHDVDELKRNSGLREGLDSEKFTKYCDYLAETIEHVANGKIGKTDESSSASEIETLKGYVNYLSECLNKVAKHNDYLAEELEKNCAHNDYLAENMNKIAKHNDYLAEELEKNCNHNDYLAEMLERNCNHNDYLAESLEKVTKHNDYLAEMLEKNYQHNDYLAENMNTIVTHNDYLAEMLEKNYQHNDYLAENMNTIIKHNDYLAESMNKVIDGEALNENTGASADSGKANENAGASACEEKLNENANRASEAEKRSDDYRKGITEKLNALISKVDERVSDTNFMNLLSEKRQNEFASLDSDTQNLITESMKAAGVRNEAQASVVWRNVYESKKGLDIVENMPEIYKENWNALSDARKNEILNEAKFYNIKTQPEVEYFWSTRDLRERRVVNEKLDTDSAKMWTAANKETDDYIGNILNRTRNNLRR